MHMNVAHQHPAISLLTKIPKGNVVTYKELARACGTSPRAIGSIMRSNKDPVRYPCYKVVASSGALGGYSGPGGCARKKELLASDGIKVTHDYIDASYFYTFTKKDISHG